VANWWDTFRDWSISSSGVAIFQNEANLFADVSGYGSLQNDPRRNALEHTYTSAQLTISYGGLVAGQLGNGLEYGGELVRVGSSKLPNFLKDSYGDAWNNQVGREIGHLVDQYGLSAQDVINLSAIAVESGWTINDKLSDSRVPSGLISPVDRLTIDNMVAVLSGGSVAQFDPNGVIVAALQKGYSTAQILNAFRGRGYAITNDGTIVDDRGRTLGPSAHAAVKCFARDTPIEMADSNTKPISEIRVGDVVMSFDPTADGGRGALVPKRVKRLFRNTTTEWIKLTWLENGEAKELVATPGHHMLDKTGAFTRLDLMVQNGKAEVVLASGEVVEAKAEHMTYSAETAHLFEQAASHTQSAANGAVGLMN
jgi:hypothetical protein